MERGHSSRYDYAHCYVFWGCTRALWQDVSGEEGPLPVLPGAPTGRDRALKHGGQLAPMVGVGSEGITVNPRKQGRGATIERDMVRMRNENQR